jgi:hypothetical protein
VIALEPAGEVLEQVCGAVGHRLLAHIAEPTRELLAGVREDLADAVVGLDVSELLVGRPLVVGRSLASRALSLLTRGGCLLAQLPL